jgi:2'-5' RNA ligase
VTEPTAVVVPVPGAEPVVGAWRERLDPAAAVGMPAHITLLHPFLEEPAPGDVAALAALCAAAAPVDVVFRRVGTFEGVVYIAPEPAAPFRALTLAIAARWPSHPPYAGAYDEVVPHLTVAFTDELETIERDLAPQLPLATRLTSAALFAFEDGRWRERERLPLGDGS